MRRIYLWICLFLTLTPVLAQPKQEVWLDIRGQVLGPDGKSIPFAHILSISEKRGCAANHLGAFRMFVGKGDTLSITAVGFRAGRLVIPDSLQSGVYPVRITLLNDTVMLSEAIIRPWPQDWNAFKHAFAALELPEEMKAIHISEDALKQAIRDANPGGCIYLPGPVSLLYDAFSRESKYRKQYIALSGENRRFEQIIHRLGYPTVAQIFGTDERDPLETYVSRCIFEDAMLEEMDNLDLIYALLRCAGNAETPEEKSFNAPIR